MNDYASAHASYAEEIPLYVSGALAGPERRELEDHLKACDICRADLALWQGVAREIDVMNRAIAPLPALLDRALARVNTHRVGVFFRAYELVRAQVPLVHGELWPASAAIMAIGFIVATIVKDVAVLRMLAPLVAAASIAVIYGPETDPALELTLATATSPWKILLARLALVFGYNLVLALAASCGMLLLIPADTVAHLILDWLGPMTFLSAAALVLALWVGTGNAILATYLAWLTRFLPVGEIADRFQFGNLAFASAFLDGYRQFWMNSLLLVALAGVLVAAAGWLAARQEHHLIAGAQA